MPQTLFHSKCAHLILHLYLLLELFGIMSYLLATVNNLLFEKPSTDAVLQESSDEPGLVVITYIF